MTEGKHNNSAPAAGSDGGHEHANLTDNRASGNQPDLEQEQLASQTSQVEDKQAGSHLNDTLPSRDDLVPKAQRESSQREDGDALESQQLPPIHDERLGAKTFVPNVALELYEIAAKQGDAQAQYNLGLCYHYGEGTLKDPNKAFQWFRQAAQGGHAEGQYSLGVYYQLGIGTTVDAEKAFKWFERAASQNQAKAQHELGESYINGRGVQKNPAMAKKWINKSYINGNRHASESWEKYQLWKY